MAVVEIRCPRCGSPCAQESKKPNEYICPNCKATFYFVDATQRVVTTEVRVRNCLFCGVRLRKEKATSVHDAVRSTFVLLVFLRLNASLSAFTAWKSWVNYADFARKFLFLRVFNVGFEFAKNIS